VKGEIQSINCLSPSANPASPERACPGLTPGIRGQSPDASRRRAEVALTLRKRPPQRQALVRRVRTFLENIRLQSCDNELSQKSPGGLTQIVHLPKKKSFLFPLFIIVAEYI